MEHMSNKETNIDYLGAFVVGAFVIRSAFSYLVRLH